MAEAAELSQQALENAGSGATSPQPQAPSFTSAVTGTVTMEQGSPISGAEVRLSCAQRPEQESLTDIAGHFVFEAQPAGPCTVTAALPGFNSAVQQVDLRPGVRLQLAPFLLSLATVHISVDALTPEQAALEELHTEEHQRLVGVLPNFFVSYNWVAPPLTAKQKFTLATKNASDPGNLALVGTVAGVQQATNAFPGYHQGAAGYGKRYGADLANLVVGTYLGGAVFPSLFHQDPRYFYKGTGSTRSRFFYSISRAIITRGDNGHNQPNFAGVLGDLSAGAISNIYYAPSDRQGPKLFLENGFLAIAGDMMNGFVQEFFLNRITSKGASAKKARQGKPETD